MKKTASIFFVLIFLFNSTGYLFIYFAVKESHEAFVRHETPGLHSLTSVSKKALNTRYSDGQEFVLGNFYYDVVSQDKQNYYCIKDSGEKEIANALNKSLPTNDLTKKPIKTGLDEFIFNITTIKKPFFTISFSFCPITERSVNRPNLVINPPPQV